MRKLFAFCEISDYKIRIQEAEQYKENYFWLVSNFLIPFILSRFPMESTHSVASMPPPDIALQYSWPNSAYNLKAFPPGTCIHLHFRLPRHRNYLGMKSYPNLWDYQKIIRHHQSWVAEPLNLGRRPHLDCHNDNGKYSKQIVGCPRSHVWCVDNMEHQRPQNSTQLKASMRWTWHENICIITGIPWWLNDMRTYALLLAFHDD